MFICLSSKSLSFMCFYAVLQSIWSDYVLFFSSYSKDLKIFFNSYFQAPSFSLRNQSVIFFPKFRIWMLIYAILSHFKYPLPCPYFLKKLYFSYRQNQVCKYAVYGRPLWAHKSIKETQFAGKTICSSTNGVIPITLNRTAFISELHTYN